MNHETVHRLSSLVLAAVLASPAAANVLVVSPTGPFTDIQSALDAAAVSGDTILVKAGSYPTFAIVNKSVDVVADTGANVQVNGAVRVRNLAAGREVVISGLQVHGVLTASDSFMGDGLFATQCAGSIRVQDCGISCALVQNSCDIHPAAEIDHCADVVMVRCTLVGSAWGGGWSPPGGPGLRVSSSSIALHECSVHGGRGGRVNDNAYCPAFPGGGNDGDGEDGGDGLAASASFVFASSSQFVGGSGGDGTCFGSGIADGGDGGTGLVLLDTACVAQVMGCTFQGGFGGNFCCTLGCGDPGYAGFGTVYFPGTSWTSFSDGPWLLQAPSPVRELSTEVLTIHGAAGDDVFLCMTAHTQFVDQLPFEGVSICKPTSMPMRFFIAGAIPANGVLAVPLTVPDLGPGVQSRHSFCQPFVHTSSGTWRLGEPASIVVLDQAF